MKEADQLGVAPTPAPNMEEMRVAMEEVFGLEYSGRFADPVVPLVRVFRSPAAIQFFKREFPLISRTLHLESVYRRRWEFNVEVLDAFAQLSARKLSDIQQMLHNQADRLRKLCEQNGAKDMVVYLHPVTKVIPVIHSGARSYIDVLERLDEVYSLTGAATISGIIDGNQRASFELLCRKAVRAYTAMVRSESIKLRKEVQRMYAARDLAQSEEEAQAEQAVQKATDAFDQSVAAEANIDPSGQVDGE